MLSTKPIDLDCRSPDIARKIHTVWQAAYGFEAKLLEIDRFPPLNLSAIDLQKSHSIYRGVEVAGQLIGAIGHEPNRDNCEITSLIVLPQFHRRGIAKLLITDLLDKYQSVTVSTAAKNAPAISLYTNFGFVEIDRTITAIESIEIIHFQKITSSWMVTALLSLRH